MNSVPEPYRHQLPGQVHQQDYHYLQEVVRVSFPVRDAITFLNRHVGNPIQYRLVEALRGERPGFVRAIEVQSSSGGEPTYIRALRVLPDGAPASYFTPDELVTIVTEVITPDGRPPGSIGPKDKIVLHVPVRGYLRYLPGLYQGAVPAQRRDIVRADEVSQRRWGGGQQSMHATEVQGFNADALRRFLFIFQHVMTTVTDRIDALPSLIDPSTTDPNFLPWIASWVGFELDSALPVHQQRELVRRAIRLYRTRGTVKGIEEMIKVLTAADVRVEELRKPKPMVLGQACLSGGASVDERYRHAEPGAAYMVGPERAATSFFAVILEPMPQFRARFGERAPVVLRRIAQIVTNEKPAHVTFTILFSNG